MTESSRTKLSARAIAARKHGPKLVMLAAYDFPTARLAEGAAVDLILCGDSVGMTMQGHASTVPVTLDQMIYHTQLARRGAPATHIVGDLPFLTYQLDDAQALANAGRLLQEGGADSVKLEGGELVADRIRALVSAGVPVMGHVGLGPQSVGVTGGFRVQGRDVASAKQVLADARAVEAAGAFAVVLEMVPAEVAALVTQEIGIPTIGIGAGPACDGQVLVWTDVVGLDDRISLKFARRYASVGEEVSRAFADFAADVRTGAFPNDAESFHLKPGVLEALRAEIGGAE